MRKSFVEKNEREAWVDILKGIAIIFVVLGHVVTSYHNSNMLLSARIFNFVGIFVYAFHMPLFFVISGYLAGKSKKNDTVGKKILGKCICYGIPYVIFSVVSVTLKLLARSVVNTPLGLMDLLMIVVYPISYLWFLYALLLISVISLLLKRLVKNNYLVVVIVSLVCKVAMNIVLNVYSLQDGKFSESILFSVIEYYFWYVLGEYLSSKFTDEIKHKLKNIKYVWCALLLCMFAGVVWLFNFHFQIGWSIVNILVSFLGIAVFWLICIKISSSRVLGCIGKQTFPIYLMHGYVVSFVRIVLNKLHIPLIEGLVPLFIGTVVGVVVPLCLYAIIVKFKGLDFVFYPQRYISITKKK